MNEKKTISIIGGDLRFISLARLFKDIEYEIRVMGFDNSELISDDDGLISFSDIHKCVCDSDCIVLPLPFSADGKYINAPLNRNLIKLEDLYKNMGACQLVVGGMLDNAAYIEAGHRGFRIIDYFEREELAVKNAILTVEGALQLAMEETAISIHNSNCLVIGFGRIGKILCRNLNALGAFVTASARRYSDFAWIDALGYKNTETSKLQESIENYDIIFNTVPSLILDEHLLKNIKKDSLVIDLASKPGGVDFDKARQLGVKVIWALSLPGKVAPLSSGKIIKETILNILKEENI